VRGGNFSEGLVRGTPWKSFSCEAETPQKAFSCEVKESHASESTPRNSYVTEKQLQQMKFLLRNITFLT
jgi:CRISPR/Cas system-associated protein endoribonuclease Cas2